MGATRRTTGRGRIAAGLAVLMIGVAAFAAGPASAQSIEVPIADVAVKGDPGTAVPIGSTEVAEDLRGRSCDVAITVTNQVSEHPGNKLVITSGESRIEVEGIEDTANGITEASGTLTLGATIDVSVMLGNSNITSLGSALKVTCEPLPPTPPPPPVKGEPPYTG